jgi:6-phospho-3-hexuloisomerase|tara:strand:+ start:757 stop:1359 length:603 start_codon:yes stop_codon:yes gene_type:complete
MKFKPLSKIIINEISDVILSIPESQTQELIEQITKSQRIFLIAVGRVNLSLQCFGKRLSHLGFKVELVGSLTEKPATKKDLLIVASGSGESIIPLNIAKKAKKIGCKILHITSAKKSTIRKLADYVVEIKSPTKLKKYNSKKNEKESLSDSASKTKKSIQPMSTIFDQVLHIYGDLVVIQIIDKMKINKINLWKYHANLE